MRRRKDIPEGDFKVPFYPIIPILSGLACIGMMCFLSVKTYIFAGIWFYLDYLFTAFMDISIARLVKEIIKLAKSLVTAQIRVLSSN